LAIGPPRRAPLREVGLLLRDQGDYDGAGQALDASQAIFSVLGDAIWTARVLASKASVEELRGGDPVPLSEEAEAICRRCGITAEKHVASALREW
jgi:hypothetical protein